MTFPVRLLPEAKTEFDAAADWYEQKQAGLGIDFIVRVGEVFKRIAGHRVRGCLNLQPANPFLSLNPTGSLPFSRLRGPGRPLPDLNLAEKKSTIA